MTHYFPSIQHIGKEYESKHTVLRDGQPQSVAFTILAQLCGPKAHEREMNATLIDKNGEDFRFFCLLLTVGLFEI